MLLMTKLSCVPSFCLAIQSFNEMWVGQRTFGEIKRDWNVWVSLVAVLEEEHSLSFQLFLLLQGVLSCGVGVSEFFPVMSVELLPPHS